MFGTAQHSNNAASYTDSWKLTNTYPQSHLKGLWWNTNASSQWAQSGLSDTPPSGLWTPGAPHLLDTKNMEGFKKSTKVILNLTEGNYKNIIRLRRW